MQGQQQGQGSPGTEAPIDQGLRKEKIPWSISSHFVLTFSSLLSQLKSSISTSA
jgi:hypothetical protein